MKSALRSPVLRFVLLFSALLGVALGLAAMSYAPDTLDNPAPTAGSGAPGPLAPSPSR